MALSFFNTECVTEAVLGVFCRFWMPRKMLLFNLGTPFTSELMQEMRRLLSIQRLTTSPYHPKYNGLFESFNGKSKLMLKRSSAEGPKA